MTKTTDLLTAMRSGWTPSHEELVDFCAGFASFIKHGQHGLSNACKAFLIDQIDECGGQIENDQIEQQSEQAWRLAA